jgi:glycosyltransferase involved in cell wall biosynthesis
MARIYLDTWCMNSESSGMGRYGRGLIPALVAAAPRHEFIILRPAGHATRGPLIPPSPPVASREVFMRRPRPDWTTVLAQPLLARVFSRYGRPDIYHSLFHVLPVGLRSGRFAPRRIVVTLHDLIWIDHAHDAGQNWLAAEWLERFGRAAIPYALRTADHVICGSDATSNRAAAWLTADRKTTVHYGIEDAWLVPAAAPAAASPAAASPPYIAAFGVPKPYKNIALLVRAFARLRQRRPDVHLVLIGGDGGAGPQIRSAKLDAHVTVTGSLNDGDLRALVSGARVFVVPSLVEGFGLPALEAMALGTPLVISDTEALREVAGDAALRFDAADPAQLADVIIRALEDEALGRELAARGRVRAARFRWSRAAAQTLAVYDLVLNARPAPGPRAR